MAAIRKFISKFLMKKVRNYPSFKWAFLFPLNFPFRFRTALTATAAAASPGTAAAAAAAAREGFSVPHWKLSQAEQKEREISCSLTCELEQNAIAKKLGR